MGDGRAGGQREASPRLVLPSLLLPDSQDVSGLKALVAPAFFHPQAFDPRRRSAHAGWLDRFLLPHDLSLSLLVTHPSWNHCTASQTVLPECPFGPCPTLWSKMNSLLKILLSLNVPLSIVPG